MFEAEGKRCKEFDVLAASVSNEGEGMDSNTLKLIIGINPEGNAIPTVL